MANCASFGGCKSPLRVGRCSKTRWQRSHYWHQEQPRHCWMSYWRRHSLCFCRWYHYVGERHEYLARGQNYVSCDEMSYLPNAIDKFNIGENTPDSKQITRPIRKRDVEVPWVGCLLGWSGVRSVASASSSGLLILFVSFSACSRSRSIPALPNTARPPLTIANATLSHKEAQIRGVCRRLSGV
jgi:hypothetical protein